MTYRKSAYIYDMYSIPKLIAAGANVVSAQFG